MLGLNSQLFSGLSYKAGFIVAVSHTATHFIVAVSHTATHFISGSVINTEISACPVVILYSAKDPIFCILVKGELFKPSVRS